ncbi:hypothetical protein Pcac1_g1054 [Phytophthora cactorum]|nr:hypothetical protein Pcac1_g1054 [Phytophthora cactorum]
MNNCVPTRCRLADTGVDRKWLFEQILIWARVVHSCASGSMRSEASWSSHDALPIHDVLAAYGDDLETGLANKL